MEENDDDVELVNHGHHFEEEDVGLPDFDHLSDGDDFPQPPFLSDDWEPYEPFAGLDLELDGLEDVDFDHGNHGFGQPDTSF